MADKKYTIVMAGDADTGRTDVLATFADGKPSPDFELEDGEVKNKIVNIDGQNLSLTIMDTSGLEKFRSVTSSYYRKANGVVIVYDITDDTSFHNVDNWMKEIRLYARSKIATALVGNKLESADKRTVTTEEAETWAKQNSIDVFYEVSASEGTNVDIVFQSLAKVILQKFAEETGPAKTTSLGSETLSLNKPPPAEKRRKGCMI
eukprot:TRINITY_DN4196_c0_g1_i1.p1 TRINITY_DN4196_c0_g1~~TRINITY_DN4196_c0_g1_i1.p1  ORF type:complete len:205 (+),score=42.46 TRINITY_DN4196_c0_g1_i1:261-875(+)